MLSNKEFNRALGDITFVWGQRDLVGALIKLDELIPNVAPEMKAHCLLFKGTILKEQELPSDARQEWLRAIPYSRSGSFVRACLEYEIGESFRNENLVDEARIYYRSAIETCASGDEFSGNKSLSAFLAINNGKVLPDDEAIVSAALAKSWRVLELPGEPNFRDLAASIIKLSEGFSEKVRQIKES